MIFAIGAGDQLVGRTNACDWPAAAAKIPVIGAFGRPSLELLASIHPDLVIDVDLADKGTGKKITALGMRRETFSCKTPDDIPVVLRKLRGYKTMLTCYVGACLIYAKWPKKMSGLSICLTLSRNLLCAWWPPG